MIQTASQKNSLRQIFTCHGDSQMLLKQPLRRLKIHFTVVLAITICIIFLVLVYFDKPLEPVGKKLPPYGLQHRWISVNCNDGRRLGNLMFNYASLVGIAAMNNMTPFMPDERQISVRKVFLAPMTVENNWKLKMGMYYDHQEFGRRACAFDRKVKSFTPPFSIMLHGYFQSWMYFSDVEKELREKHFQFLPQIKNTSVSYLAKVIPPDFQKSDVTRVGIHVRRSDQADQKAINFGYTSATPDYFTRAMKYFEEKYQKLIFIVCSDDIKWTKENVQGENVIYSEGNSADVDLAILASMDHMIMSVGSFGWWAAWLAGGTTLYYRDWPKAASRLEYDVNKKEYFPPQWIPY